MTASKRTPPHPATIQRTPASRARAPDPSASRPPHPATLQRAPSAHLATAQPKRAPHAATVQAKGALRAGATQAPRPPHAATLEPRRAGASTVQRMEDNIEQQEIEEVKKLDLKLGPYDYPPAEIDDVSGLYKQGSGSLYIISKSSPDYDCFNWSIGHCETVLSNPPVTHGGVKALYESLGFKETDDKKAAIIAVYVYEDGFAHHVAVKREIKTLGTMWTSKLGAKTLVAHKTVGTIISDYPATSFWTFK